MGFLKMLRWAAGSPEEKELVVKPDVTRRTERIGMDKNFRVGKVKWLSSDLDGPKKILVDVMELCASEDGSTYPSSYNLWITLGKGWEGMASKNLVGKYVAVGFYMQSFRNKDASDSYSNVFSCKFLNVLADEDEARLLAMDLMESQLFIDHPSLKLSNLKSK